MQENKPEKKEGKIIDKKKKTSLDQIIAELRFNRFNISYGKDEDLLKDSEKPYLDSDLSDDSFMKEVRHLQALTIKHLKEQMSSKSNSQKDRDTAFEQLVNEYILDADIHQLNFSRPINTLFFTLYGISKRKKHRDLKVLNILEHAIFYSDKITVKEILYYSEPIRLPITNVLVKECCHPDETNHLNPLLRALRFDDSKLIEELEKRASLGVQTINIARTSDGDNVICYLMQRNRSLQMFKYLINDRKINLHYPCQNGFPPFTLIPMLSTSLDEIEMIYQALCANNSVCRRKLICDNSNPVKRNSLHLISGSDSNKNETLVFLFENGGMTCWKDLDIENQTAYDLAIRYKHHHTVDYYNNKILSISDKFKKSSLGAGLVAMSSLHIALMIIVIILFIVFMMFLFRKFSDWRKRNNQDYLGILGYTVNNQKLGPPEYFGKLNIDEILHSQGEIIKYKQLVSNLQASYVSFPHKHKLFFTPIKTGEMPSNLIYPKNRDKNIISIYVPGTASSVENSKIESTIATHLSFVLQSKVLLIHHSLAPHAQWPAQLNDLCCAIRAYYQEYKPTHINLVGYSVGGLLAILAVLVLKEFGIKIDRLILFAPALDMSGEFRDLDENNFRKFYSYLPKKLQKNHIIISNFQSQAEKDEVFNKKTKVSSKSITSGISHHQKSQINLKIEPLPENPPKPFPQMISLCFGKKFAVPLQNLRKYSPVWFDSLYFSANNFPKTTIITGENDFFILDTEIFYEKLNDAGCEASKIIIPRSDHSLIWKMIYPIYFAQTMKPESEVKLKSEEDAVDCFNEIQLYNEKLKQFEKNAEEILEYSSTLKKSCENLTMFSIFKSKNKDKSSTILVYENTFVL